jgi:hypothetical protein
MHAFLCHWNVSPLTLAQFNLWDCAPSLDEEEEELASGGFRSMMATYSQSRAKP